MKRDVTTRLGAGNQPLSRIDDAAALAERRRKIAAAATANNTKRSYLAGVRHYRNWGGFLPADPHSVEEYLVAHAETHSPSTLAARLAALSDWHNRQGFSDPTVSPSVRAALRGIRREYGKPAEKAPPLPLEGVAHLAAVLRAQGDDQAALRDAALLQVGFFATLRRSELVGIQVSDLDWTLKDVTITLPRSKTDQEGKGVKKTISYAPHAPCCPASALRAWIDSAGISEGAVFRRIDRWGNVAETALDPGSVNRILRTRAKAAGIPGADKLSSHSLRRGFATSAYIHGVDFFRIKQGGAWKKDETVQGYIDEAVGAVDNAADQLLQALQRG